MKTFKQHIKETKQGKTRIIGKTGLKLQIQ